MISGIRQVQGHVCLAAWVSADGDWLGDEQDTQQVPRLIEPCNYIPISAKWCNI